MRLALSDFKLRHYPKLAGPMITLRYEPGKLYLNQTSFEARDI